MIWLNGIILASPQNSIDATDRGFTLGDGLFETIRATGGQPHFFDRHMARLQAGGAVLGIAIPASDIVRAAIAALLVATGLTDAAIRVTVTRGPGARGLLSAPASPPTVLIAAARLAPILTPARVIIAQSTRRNEHSPLSRIKSLNYLDNILARMEADRADADADDALLLNTAGFVAEATAANLVVRIDGLLFTPPVSDGALPGVMRGLLIERGIATERRLTPELLRQADAGFLSNALGLRPLKQIGNQAEILDGRSLAENVAHSIGIG